MKNDNAVSPALSLSSEVRDCLKACRMIFPQVRLVDHDCNTAYIVDDLGNLSQSKGLCFEFWGRVEPCPNCICHKALEVPNTVQTNSFGFMLCILLVLQLFAAG